MRAQSEEILIRRIRKKEKNRHPKSGELCQGILFCLLSAIEFQEASALLFAEKKYRIAITMMTLGFEELGKIKLYIEALISWQKSENVTKLYKTQFEHAVKLSNALGFVSILLSNTTSIRLEGSLFTEILKGRDPIEFLLGLVSEELAQQYHLRKIKLMYVEFDGQRANSPHAALTLMSTTLCENLNHLSLNLLKESLKSMRKFLPIFMELGDQCYIEKDPVKLQTLKKEFNRRIDRAKPAIYKIVNDKTQEQLGKDFWEVTPEEISKSFKSISELGSELSKLILSKEPFEEKYLFPPLNEAAKAYYLSKL